MAVHPAMDDEYLVSYGAAGEFGRFRPATAADYARGDRVVVRSPSGLELGVVMCRATTGHAAFLSRTALGELVRPAAEADERAADAGRARATRMAEEAAALARQLALPVEILDVELSLDGRRAIVHHLRRSDCDYRPLVSALARQYDVLVTMENLADPVVPAAGCGRPGCGGGGCGSCGAGGCASGGCGDSCGRSFRPDEVAAHLAALAHGQGNGRTPLL